MKWFSFLMVSLIIFLSPLSTLGQNLSLEAQFRGGTFDIEFREIPIEAKEVFITGSFSPNNDPYVIVSGDFPDGCHRWSRAEVLHKSERLHEVILYGVVSNSKCLMVDTPFIKEVRLGRLAPGEHTVRFFNVDGSFFERQLIVD